MQFFEYLSVRYWYKETTGTWCAGSGRDRITISITHCQVSKSEGGCWNRNTPREPASLRDQACTARAVGATTGAACSRDTLPPRRRRRGTPHRNWTQKKVSSEMPRPEGVLSMKARSLFARKHRRFVAISQGGLSTFKLQKPEDIAVLETRKDLPFDYVEGVRLDGSRFVVRRRKPWRSDVVFYCATAPAARAWAEALRSRLDAFRNKARVQFPPLNESLGPNLSPRPELPPYPPASPARLKAGQVDVAG